MFQKGDVISTTHIILGTSHPLGGEFVLDSIKPIADFLMRYPELNVEIAVYTDSRGSYEGNHHLSGFRATTTKDALIHHYQIDASRLSSKGYGKSKLIISNSQIKKAKTPEEQQKLRNINQRVELIVTGIKTP